MTRFAQLFLLLLALLVAGCAKDERTLTSDSPEAIRLYREGVVQWEKFYYTEARALFEQAVKHDSSFAMAWARIAMIDMSSHNEPSAFANMDRAVKYASKTSVREQLLIRMWNSHVHYDVRTAAILADSLLTLYPKEKEVYVFRGGLYEGAKDFDAAIRLYQKAAALDTGYATPVMMLGYAYSSIGQQEKALSWMERYIRMAPDAADPRASYADLLLRVGRYDEALAQYRKSLELKPDYWYAVRMIGEIYSILGRLREAEEQFQRAQSLLPPTSLLAATQLTSKAQINLLRGEYETAVKQFTAALRMDTTTASPAFGLALANIKLHKFADAEAMLSRVSDELAKRNLKTFPVMVSYHLAWSRLELERNQPAEALAHCDSALGFSTLLLRAPIYRLMAEAYLKQHAYDQALDACSEALAVNPNSTDVLLTLTRIYHQRHDRAMTREIGSRLLSLWKDADADFVYSNELRRLLLPT